MKSDYQQQLFEESQAWNKIIHSIINQYASGDFFCSIDRDSILRDIQTNLFIKHSPAIVVVLDYGIKGYVYVSENVKAELDIDPNELLEQGFGRAMTSFEENQKNLFIEQLYPTIFKTFADHAPLNQAKDLHVTYNTLLKTTRGHYEWYYHQMSVLACDEQGFPRYGFKLISNIDKYKKDEKLNFNIYKKNGENEHEVIFSKDFLPYKIDHVLSDREKEIMKLVEDGMSTKMIADKLFISTNTVSTHRKNLLRKLKE
ncbi:MAG TPA: helix-turn-helix transcriptional regulator [Cytophagaceae bacterium]|nr:helix-turn-helix transcriptional regulator [Cytophagaceae bacterium]